MVGAINGLKGIDVPALVNERSVNVATPLTALAVTVPSRVAPKPTDRVTADVSEVTTVLFAPSIVTVTAGAMVLPAVVVVGSWVNTRTFGRRRRKVKDRHRHAEAQQPSRFQSLGYRWRALATRRLLRRFVLTEPSRKILSHDP